MRGGCLFPSSTSISTGVWIRDGNPQECPLSGSAWLLAASNSCSSCSNHIESQACLGFLGRHEVALHHSFHSLSRACPPHQTQRRHFYFFTPLKEHTPHRTPCKRVFGRFPVIFSRERSKTDQKSTPNWPTQVSRRDVYSQERGGYVAEIKVSNIVSTLLSLRRCTQSASTMGEASLLTVGFLALWSQCAPSYTEIHRELKWPKIDSGRPSQSDPRLTQKLLGTFWKNFWVGFETLWGGTSRGTCGPVQVTPGAVDRQVNQTTARNREPCNQKLLDQNKNHGTLDCTNTSFKTLPLQHGLSKLVPVV